ncbi:MAG: lipoyl synthase [Candidatus Acetothermia bacterium]
MNSIPKWIKTIAPGDTDNERRVSANIGRYNLHSVCEEADCPNQGECWKDGTATFLLLGDTCTRNCKFCDVKTGNPEGALDEDEPKRLRRAVEELGLTYVVLTSVDRDDLPDYGAGGFKRSIESLLEVDNPPLIEALIPDFSGDTGLLTEVAETGLNVVGHNVETVERLSPEVRDPRASYEQSLKVLSFINDGYPEIVTKSSIMVGLGETEEEVVRTMEDLSTAGVDVVTIGQYLRPSVDQLPVQRFWKLDEFNNLKKAGLEIGFSAVLSGPFVRSSYKAKKTYRSARGD